MGRPPAMFDHPPCGKPTLLPKEVIAARSHGFVTRAEPHPGVTWAQRLWATTGNWCLFGFTTSSMALSSSLSAQAVSDAPIERLRARTPAATTAILPVERALRMLRGDAGPGRQRRGQPCAGSG